MNSAKTAGISLEPSHRTAGKSPAWAASIALAILAGSGVQAGGLTFNTTFDATVTSRGDAASWISAWTYATTQFSSVYSDPITINITLKAGSASILGQTSPSIQSAGAPTFTTLKNALLADSKGSIDSIAYSHLPATDPSAGTKNWDLTFANAKALGLRTANNAANDGTVTLGDRVYTFNPANRTVAGAFDFIGVAQHEISEVMGRIGLLGLANLENSFDLFGYTAPGTIYLTKPVANGYFSIDGGVTSLRLFNNGSNGGDDKDWASGQGTDAYNAFGTSGVMLGTDLVDQYTLDVIGYDVVPEASTLVPTALAFGGLAATLVIRRRRAAK